ncbi:MAG: NAD(P)H-dependent oxidoreductase [Oscillospiraceae bacterium]|nr:NAD(P)H-dependent oxidoreductase [Oscillospiraceae bacterium]
MKRTLSIFLTLALMLTLAACGSTSGQGSTGSNPTPTPEGNTLASTAPEATPENQPEDTTPADSETPGETSDGGKKILIAYFSATNNTEHIANLLSEILDADLYEITPETPYTSADLNYNTDCRANREQNDPTARPAISGSVDNMEQYDVIFLGYPIWWGEAPRIINTFLESYDLSGKTIAPFCTSASSPLGSSARNLQGLAGNAAWLEGHRFSGGASSADVQSWVDSLNLNG